MVDFCTSQRLFDAFRVIYSRSRVNLGTIHAQVIGGEDALRCRHHRRGTGSRGAARADTRPARLGLPDRACRRWRQRPGAMSLAAPMRARRRGTKSSSRIRMSRSSWSAVRPLSMPSRCSPAWRRASAPSSARSPSRRPRPTRSPSSRHVARPASLSSSARITFRRGVGQGPASPRRGGIGACDLGDAGAASQRPLSRRRDRARGSGPRTGGGARTSASREVAASVVRQLLSGLAVHDLPLLRDLAPDLEHVIYARAVAPIGYAVGYQAPASRSRSRPSCSRMAPTPSGGSRS